MVTLSPEKIVGQSTVLQNSLQSRIVMNKFMFKLMIRWNKYTLANYFLESLVNFIALLTSTAVLFPSCRIRISQKWFIFSLRSRLKHAHQREQVIFCDALCSA